MINLMQYQAAYEANAKVITAVDEMLQTIFKYVVKDILWQKEF